MARRGMRWRSRRRESWPIRLLRRIFNPLFYLKAVIILGLFGLVLLPYGADLLAAASRPVTSPSGDCRLIAVIDGDTVTLACPERGVFRARLLGLDAPEKYSPVCTAEFVAAERATWALRMMILKAGALAVTPGETDRYGRVLVRLELDGEDVARRMIREGHARAYAGGLRGSWC